MSLGTQARGQLHRLLSEYGAATELRAALERGDLDGRCFWSRAEQVGCVLGTVFAARGVADPTMAALKLDGFDVLQGWSEVIEPGDTPDWDAGEGSGSYAAARLVQWIDEFEAGRVSA